MREGDSVTDNEGLLTIHSDSWDDLLGRQARCDTIPRLDSFQQCLERK
jgi:hypothetical protein